MVEYTNATAVIPLKGKAQMDNLYSVLCGFMHVTLAFQRQAKWAAPSKCVSNDRCTALRVFAYVITRMIWVRFGFAKFT